jgi:hypothetical protein
MGKSTRCMGPAVYHTAPCESSQDSGTGSSKQDAGQGCLDHTRCPFDLATSHTFQQDARFRLGDNANWDDDIEDRSLDHQVFDADEGLENNTSRTSLHIITTCKSDNLIVICKFYLSCFHDSQNHASRSESTAVHQSRSIPNNHAGTPHTLQGLPALPAQHCIKQRSLSPLQHVGRSASSISE